jgi:ribosomal protein S18 acetylase RimI-like enzyme
MLKIRPFRRSDLEQLTNLWKELMSDPSATIRSVLITDENVLRWQRYVMKVHEEDENQILIAELDGKLVGYTLFQKQSEYPLTTSANWASINDLYVHPSYRREGIGTKIMKQALKHLKTKGITYVRINVNVENQAAINLYRKFGFKDHSLGMQLTL